MKYYKKLLTGEVFAYESESDFNKYGETDSLSQMSEEETEEYMRSLDVSAEIKFSSALHELFNTKAQEKNYLNEFSIASYSNSTNLTWKQQATDFIAWRDACWQYAIDVQSQVEEGQIQPPSIEDFITNAPVLSWS